MDVEQIIQDALEHYNTYAAQNNWDAAHAVARLMFRLVDTIVPRTNLAMYNKEADRWLGLSYEAAIMVVAEKAAERQAKAPAGVPQTTMDRMMAYLDR